MVEEEITYLVQAVMNLRHAMWARRRKTSDSMYQFTYEKRQNDNLCGVGLWLPPTSILIQSECSSMKWITFI